MARHPYEDILNRERPVSTRARMSRVDRAAQFAPFAALTGYDGVIRETARLTDTRTELEEQEKEILDRKLNRLIQMGAEGRRCPLPASSPTNGKAGAPIRRLQARLPVCACIPGLSSLRTGGKFLWRILWRLGTSGTKIGRNRPVRRKFTAETVFDGRTTVHYGEYFRLFTE